MTDSPDEPRPPAAALFDVDGTLVDSERDGHRVAFNTAFADLDMTDRWDEETYGDLLAVSGGENRLDHYLREYRDYPEDEAAELAAELHARKTEHFQELVADGRIPPRPGMVRLIEELEAAGVPLCVTTTGSRAWVEPLLERLFGADRFDPVLTGDDVSERKPDPEVYHLALQALDVPAEATVAIEDSDSGLAAARAAGIPCLIVVNGYTREQDFDGAALVVDELDDSKVLEGPAELLDGGAVTATTLARIVRG
ncbi:MAG TPA: HAD-IA family hydrolase [Nitriliruptorales bacterium]|nr:HAD-IA family hydrolase [Nitriliruptorales bacterium]